MLSEQAANYSVIGNFLKSPYLFYGKDIVKPKCHRNVQAYHLISLKTAWIVTKLGHFKNFSQYPCVTAATLWYPQWTTASFFSLAAGSPTLQIQNITWRSAAGRQPEVVRLNSFERDSMALPPFCQIRARLVFHLLVIPEHISAWQTGKIFENFSNKFTSIYWQVSTMQCKKANLHKADWPFRASYTCLDVK